MKYEISEETLDKVNNNEDGFMLFYEDDDLVLDLTDAFVIKASEPNSIGLLEDTLKNLENINENSEEFCKNYDVFDMREVFNEAGITEWSDGISDSIQADFNSNLVKSIRKNITTDDIKVEELRKKIDSSVTFLKDCLDLDELYETVVDLCPEIDNQLDKLQEAGEVSKNNLIR